MAVEFGKGIRAASSFDLGSKAPLDSRITVATIADRDAHVTGNRAYEGMLVYVEADKTLYQYIDSSWKPLLGNLDNRLNAVESQLGVGGTTGEGSTIKDRVKSLEQKIGAPANSNDAASGLFSNISSLETKDTELKGKIDAEVEARKTADADLQAKIDSVNNDTTGIYARAVTEATRLDEVLKGELQSEIDADVKVVSDALTDEIARAKAAEKTNVNAIAQEISDRQKAISDHLTNITHVTYESNVPQTNGTANAGTSTSVSRGDHVHPLQTEVSGNAGTATKLQTPVNINGVAFDGSKDITIEDNTKVEPTGTIVANHVAVFNDTTGKIIKDSGFTIAKSVPADAVFTDTKYGNATTSESGLMSSSDKSKLDGIAEGANNYIHPTKHEASMIIEDNTHRFVTDEEKNKWNNKSDFDGNYNNLTNKPSIPTKMSELENDSDFTTNSYVNEMLGGKRLVYLTQAEYDILTEEEKNNENVVYSITDIDIDYVTKDELHYHDNKVVLDGITEVKVTSWNNKSDFSGNYNDLTNKPSIPTKTSELENDSVFVTNTELDSKGYLTEHQDISGKVDKVEGKSLISNTEIERLANITNYDDTEIKAELNNKANLSDLHQHDNKTVLDGITANKITSWDNKSDFSGDYNDLANKPNIPTQTSQLINNSGFLTSIPSEYITETELEAKGYLTEHQSLSEYATKDDLHYHDNKTVLNGITANKVTSWDNKSDFSGSYNDLTNKPSIPTKTSELVNDSNFAMKTDLNSKVDKVEGKSLISDTEIERLANVTNYDDTEIKAELNNKADISDLHQHTNKEVLDGITANKITSWDNKSDFSGSYNDLTDKPSIPTKTSELVNNSNFATKTDLNSKVDKVEGKSLISDTEIERLANVTNYDDTKIKEELNNKADISDLHQHDNKAVLDGITEAKVTSWDNKSDFSGSYNDLTNKPNIPTKTSQLTNDSSFLTSVPSEYITETELDVKGYLTEHQSLSNYATKNELHSHDNKKVLDGITANKITSWDNKSNFSGNYNDLTNKPNIPSLDGYATIEDLKSKDLKEGMIVRTLGYYDLNDGGCAEYYIKVKDGTEDTLLNIPLNDGIHVAMLLLNSNKLNVKTVGVRYGSSNYKIANSEIIQNIIKKYNSDYILYFPKGDVWVSNIHFLDAPSNFSPHIRICGEGINDTKINTDGDDLFYDKRTDSTNFYLEAKDITMQTKSFVVTGWIPKGICFGMIKNNNNSETNFRFTNVNIVGFEYGVYAPNYACGGSGGDNVTFYMCKYGIYINDASHCFNITNVSCNYCANGINLGVGGEGNLIRNFHSATGYLGEDKDEIEHFVSIYTRGNLTIDGLYYEPYESSASTNKHIMIDYEPYPQEWGGRPLTLRNCNIGYPGAGNTGLFMRVGCYLGASYGRPNESGEYTYLKPMDGHYWDGIINWEQSTSISVSSFKKLIEFKNKEDGKLLYLGNSIKGNCVPEIYDEDYILNKKNTLYISTNPSSSYSSPSGIIKFAYNSLSEYCPLHSTNKDSVSQTNASIIQNSNTTKKIEVSGYVEISELSSNNGNTEFDIKLCSGDYSWFIGHFKNEIGGSKKVFPFYITIPQHEITNKNIREELVIAFEYADDKKYDGSIDYQNVYFNYTHSIIIN